MAIGNREVNTMSAGESFSANILKVDFAEEFQKKKTMIVLLKYDEKNFFRKQKLKYTTVNVRI